MTGAGRRVGRIDVGRSVPGALVHLAVTAVLVAGFVLVVPLGWWTWPLVAVAVVAGAYPPAHLAWFGVAAIAAGVLARPGDGTTAIALACVHVVHVAASIGLSCGPATRVSLRLLARSGLRLVAIQAPAQVLLVLVDVVSGGTGRAAIALLAPAAALAIAALVAAFALSLRDDAPGEHGGEGDVGGRA